MIAAMYGPTFAAIIMLCRERRKAGIRDLFGRIIKWRIGIKGALALVLLPLIIEFSVIGLNLLLG